MAGSNDKKQVIRVFIASPGGLEVARRAFKDKIDELNNGFGDGAGVEFVPLGWEDTLSPAGQRVQSEINKDVESCHLFLLLLDKVWGRRNKDAVWHPVACLPGLAKLRASNTMEEFSLAMSRWEKLKCPFVHVALKKLPVDANRDPGVELKCVLKFRRILAQSERCSTRSGITPTSSPQLSMPSFAHTPARTTTSQATLLTTPPSHPTSGPNSGSGSLNWKPN